MSGSETHPAALIFLGFKTGDFKNPQNPHGRRGTICGMRRIWPGLDLSV